VYSVTWPNWDSWEPPGPSCSKSKFNPRGPHELGVELVQVKHASRVSKEDQQRNRRFQRDLLGLIDGAKTLGESEGVSPGKLDEIPVDKGAERALAPEPSQEKPIQKPPPVPSVHKEKLEKFKVYFSAEDLEILGKVSAARGQQPSDFVRLATLKLFAELGAVDGERKRLLLLFK
jgi:hypothetical protein